MWRRLCLWAVFAGVTMAAFGAPLSPPVYATVQDQGICWDPDVEFPIACDDEEE